MSSINQLLLSKWNNKFRDFGLSMTDLGRNNNVGSFDSYFFLKRELEYNTYKKWRQAKRDGMIRHCIIHDGKFYDYIVNKHYDSLEDWLYSVDADASFYHDVLYGSNRVHRGIQPNYVSFDRLLQGLGYKYDIPPPRTYRYETMNPEEDSEEEYTEDDIEEEEEEEDYSDIPSLIPVSDNVDVPDNSESVHIPELPNITIPKLPSEDNFGDLLKQLSLPDTFVPLPVNGRKCLVQRDDKTIVIGRFMDYKYFDMCDKEDDDTKSQIFLNVPELSGTCIHPHVTRKLVNTMYFKLSQLPVGWKVYVKSNVGHFDVLENLLYYE
jgi:hypothetical protein